MSDDSGGFSSRLLRYLPTVLGTGPSILDDRPTLLLSPSQPDLPDPSDPSLPDSSAKPMSLQQQQLDTKDKIFADAESYGFGFGLDSLDGTASAQDVDAATMPLPVASMLAP
jgi:hypothetical protein